MFEIRMLSIFGYRPNLTRCSVCKRDLEALRETPGVFFSLEKGALLCGECPRPAERLIGLSLGTARLIEEISEAEFSRISRFRFTPQALSESREILPRFISYQLGKELKSHNFSWHMS